MKPIHFIFSVFAIIAMLGIPLSSCNDFLTSIDPPVDQFEAGILFNDDVTANAAILGIYANLLTETYGFAQGNNTGLAALTGLSADELTNHAKVSGSDQFSEFEQNNLRAANSYILSLWSSMYKTIYLCNSAIEGLSKSKGTSGSTRHQLLGEALFIRAFTHFQLVNLFGEVPLVVTTNYETNGNPGRSTVDVIYQQIVSDLIKAQESLKDEYPTLNNERVRANKLSATALLARAYLFMGEWQEAEIQSSIVISKQIYDLKQNLSDVFLKNSTEAIWQLRPNVNPDPTKGYANEGLYFSLSYTPNNNSIRKGLVKSFDSSDKRFISWISSFLYGTDTLYRPTKYKIYDYNAPLTEYSTVLRLAEQYLIRAEARAQQNNLTPAIEDLNVLRRRAGLAELDKMNQEDILNAVYQERRWELFTEWGHRWFDLKRSSRAVAVLRTVKLNFDESDLLYPVPQIERSKNPGLTQNPGY